MEELESLLERVDHNSKVQIEELTARLHTKSSEASGLSLENERLKVGVNSGVHYTYSSLTIHGDSMRTKNMCF